MATLVTGAGIIGCYTAQYLAEKGEKVILCDIQLDKNAISTIVKSPLVTIKVLDVTHLEDVQQTVEAFNIQQVVHTAAMLSHAIRQNPILGVQVNVMGAMNLLETARKMNLRRVVLASSATLCYPAFGDYHGEPFPEDFQMKYLTNRPVSIYSATKVHVEHLALLYRDLYNVSTVSLRYAAVMSLWSGPSTSIITQLLSTFIEGASKDEPLIIDNKFLVWKGGEEFVDARDCALANVAALESSTPQQGVYTIACNQLYSFSDFMYIMKECYPSLEVDVRVEPAGGFAGFPHIRQSYSDISSAETELNWKPKYSLKESVMHFSTL